MRDLGREEGKGPGRARLRKVESHLTAARLCQISFPDKWIAPDFMADGMAEVAVTWEVMGERMHCARLELWVAAMRKDVSNFMKEIWLRERLLEHQKVGVKQTEENRLEDASSGEDTGGGGGPVGEGVRMSEEAEGRAAAEAEDYEKVVERVVEAETEVQTLHAEQKALSKYQHSPDVAIESRPA